MDVVLRPLRPDDARDGGRVLYEAFKSIADRHGFPADFQSPDAASRVFAIVSENPSFYGVVAERQGELIGSNFMDERSIVFGIGPISVAPAAQNARVGRRLMQDTLDRATARNAAGVRLLQAAYHNRSLCLYTSLGFQTREPMSVMQGPPLGLPFAGYPARPARPTDFAACNALCRDVHGFDRGAELRAAIERGSAMVIEHLGEISGYSTQLSFLGHSVARSDRDLMALIGAAAEIPGPGFIVPTRNHWLFTWCLANGFKLVNQMTLMTIGLYNEPAGAYTPSVLY